ncbi:MAG: hypothetical protein EOP53_09480 [Sphingobacteriales bacterium]|nr:MAG: hypothetical protein EOP53_09480 [Sphingobacteriales bacterium]
MKKTKITWIAFVLLVVLQLWVPASVIRNKENVLATGNAYKFRTAPRDPNDYLRGKYVYLNFNETSFETTGTATWKSGQQVYASLGTDSAGFAKITGINANARDAGKDYIKTSINYVDYENARKIYVHWPFDRFYMEESKAPLAEEAYNNSTIDSSLISYALVKVKKGEAVLENVYINDKPIDEFIKK